MTELLYNTVISKEDISDISFPGTRDMLENMLERKEIQLKNLEIAEEMNDAELIEYCKDDLTRLNYSIRQINENAIKDYDYVTWDDFLSSPNPEIAEIADNLIKMQDGIIDVQTECIQKQTELFERIQALPQETIVQNEEEAYKIVDDINDVKLAMANQVDKFTKIQELISKSLSDFNVVIAKVAMNQMKAIIDKAKNLCKEFISLCDKMAQTLSIKKDKEDIEDATKEDVEEMGERL